MTILQNYTFKGILFESCLKITNYKITPITSTTNDIELTINRYTNCDCEYDIEQFTKCFCNVSTDDIPLDDLGLIEAMLLLEPELEGATIS